MPDQVPEFVRSVCCEVMAFGGAGSCRRYWNVGMFAHLGVAGKHVPGPLCHH